MERPFLTQTLATSTFHSDLDMFSLADWGNFTPRRFNRPESPRVPYYWASKVAICSTMTAYIDGEPGRHLDRIPIRLRRGNSFILPETLLSLFNAGKSDKSQSHHHGSKFCVFGGHKATCRQ